MIKDILMAKKDFSRSEQIIANYILQSGKEALELSILELANKTYASTSTITRLCKKLGVLGYTDFKVKYSAELQRSFRSDTKMIDINIPFGKSDSCIEIADKLASLVSNTVIDTFRLIGNDNLFEIVDILLNATYIDIYSNGTNQIVNAEFQMNMMKIGKVVSLFHLSTLQICCAINSNNQHVAIIVSQSGETEDMINVAEYLIKNKTPIVCITRSQQSTLGKMADKLIYIGSNEMAYKKITHFSSSVAIKYIFDVLFSCIYSREFEKNFERNKKYEKELNMARRDFKDEG